MCLDINVHLPGFAINGQTLRKNKQSTPHRKGSGRFYPY